MSPRQHTTAGLLLTLSAAFIFLGRAYEYLFFDAPLRVLLWDEALLTPIVTGVFGRGWTEYATDPSVVATIGSVQSIIGGWWIFCGVLCGVGHTRYRKWMKWIVWIGVFFLLIHSFLKMKDHFYHLAQFFEFGIQLVVPLLWVAEREAGVDRDRLIFFAKVAIAVTFAAHGLYALGAYPVPGNFVDMSIVTLGLSEDGARLYLQIAGVLDLLVAVLIFVPRADRYALVYATVWGLATALARCVYGWRVGYGSFVHDYLYQTIFRLPHGMLPLIVLFWVGAWRQVERKITF